MVSLQVQFKKASNGFLRKSEEWFQLAIGNNLGPVPAMTTMQTWIQ